MASPIVRALLYAAMTTLNVGCDSLVTFPRPRDGLDSWAEHPAARGRHRYRSRVHRPVAERWYPDRR